MAIDTRINSLDAGASDITYTGNEGPKSPQQEQQMQMQQQQMQQMKMASLMQEYKDYAMQQEEAGRPVMPFEEWVRSMQSPMAYGGTAHPTYTQSRKQRINAAGGGIMGSNAGSMLVAPTADGSRPGYAWWNPMDWIPNEIKDPIAKIIPNELKNPAVAAIAANYLPSLIPGGDATLLQKGKRLISQLGNVDQINKAIMPLNYAPQNPSFDEQYGDIEDIIAGQPGKLGTGPITINKPAPRLTDIIPEGTGTTGEGWLYNLGQGAKDLAEGLGGTIGAGVGALGTGIGALAGGAGNIAKKIGQTIIPGGETGYVEGGLYNALNPFSTASASTRAIEDLSTKTDTSGGKIKTDKGTDQDLGFWREALATILPGGDPGFIPGGMYNQLLGRVDAQGNPLDPKDKGVNILGPVAGGVAAGLIQSQMPQAQLPQDTSGIDIADIRSRALTGSDPDLHFLPPASATTAYAQGGRTGYDDGSLAMNEENVPQMYVSDEGGALPKINGGILPEDLGNLTLDDFESLEDYIRYTRMMNSKAQGGRTGYATGDRVQKNMITAFSTYKNKGGKSNFNKWFSDVWLPESQGIAALPIDEGTIGLGDYPLPSDTDILGRPRQPVYAAQGGRIGAQEGGLMNLGGMEKDYRQEGGFVPLGGEEKADDVPARLSKNEFVFTADAVRAAGGGDIDAGAEVMENVLNNLEQGGQMSEESQGLEGARDMFATAQRLEGVL